MMSGAVDHLRPLLRGSERCAQLITTRILDIAAHANAGDMLTVDEMSTEQAANMLLTGLDAVVDREPFRTPHA